MSASDRAYTATVTAAGVATVTVQTGNGTKSWIVSQVSVELASAPLGSTCELRKNGNLVTPLVATGDAATGDPPVTLWPTDTMTVVWTGCTSGTIARVYLIFDEVAYR